jgi:hypothetical protein
MLCSLRAAKEVRGIMTMFAGTRQGREEFGPWAGDILGARLPDRFIVDSVRVYDLIDAG